MRCLVMLVPLLLLAPLGCKSGDDPDPDVGVEADAVAGPDQKIADEPFGRACSTLGKECPDKDPEGHTLTCIGVANGAAGKGFCSRQCTDVGNECFGAPNGQFAACILKAGGDADAGPAAQYCAFLCKQKTNVWTCPGSLRCGPASGDTALCVP